MEMTQYPASTLRRWVKSFNERGIDGLVTHPCGGRPRKISQEAFTQQFSHILESPSDHGFDFMTVVRLHGHLTEELQHEISYSTVLRYVHDAGFALKVPGRKHPDANDADREVFLERLRKELDRDDFASGLVHVSRPITGEIDKQLVARLVLQAHDRMKGLGEITVVLKKLTSAVTIGVDRLVLLLGPAAEVISAPEQWLGSGAAARRVLARYTEGA